MGKNKQVETDEKIMKKKDKKKKNYKHEQKQTWTQTVWLKFLSPITSPFSLLWPIDCQTSGLRMGSSDISTMLEINSSVG